MTDAQSIDLDILLCLWHDWQRCAKRDVARGYNSKSVGIGDFRGYGLQYESQLEQQDANADALRCRQVDYEVKQLGEPHASAIHEDARNLYTGIAVWVSPRLPADEPSRDIIVAAARGALTRRLISAGVME